jgi:hypothetical protein
MSGRFEGELFRNIFHSEVHGCHGRPAANPCNILIVGCRWRGLPQGPQWASKSSSHRRLKSWYQDGTFNEIKARLPGPAQNEGLSCWTSGAVDGSFSPWERRRH